jgi:prepilin-type processing-associated H-X9-DG protein
MSNLWQGVAKLTQAVLIAVFLAAIVLEVLVLYIGIDHPSWKARAVACASNMKQIGLALAQYEQDNDELAPNVAHAGKPSVTWRNDLYPYIKSTGVFQCASRRNPGKAPDGLARGYAANDSGVWGRPAGSQGLGAFAPAGAKPLGMMDYPAPERLVAVCEITRTDAVDFDADDSVRFAPRLHRVWAGHNGKANLLMADGHVRRVIPAAMADYPAVPGGPGVNWWYRDGSPLSQNGIATLKAADDNGGKS